MSPARRAAAFSLGTALFALAGAANLAAEQPIWIGPELQLNVTTAGSQTSPALAALPDGGFFAAWQSAGQDGSGAGVYGRRYAANGSAIGGEVHLATTSAGDQVTPALAAAPDGTLLATWASAGQDGDGYAIVARRFDAAGAPLGGELVVNVTTAGSQTSPRVAASGAGYVVVWSGPGGADGNEVFARRITLAGSFSGNELRLNATVSGQQLQPAVAAFSDGAFVAAWASEGQDGSGYAVVARRFDAAGAALGGETVVPSITLYDQTAPAIATLADGFVVAWQRALQSGATPIGPQPVIALRRFDLAGVPLGGESQATPDTSRRHESPELAADPEGGFTLAWQESDLASGDQQCAARRYDGAGVASTAEFPLNTTPTGDQIQPALAAGAPGRFVAAWASFGQDGSAYGIFAQRFGTPVEPCAPDATTLCLNGDRFRVRATYRTAAGASGSGQAFELTADSGYFWFFDDDNVEIVIKVLDACGLAGFENFWVFATGLTNVEVNLSVLDTATGEAKLYPNALNQDFAPILDTASFPVCGANLAPPPPASPAPAPLATTVGDCAPDATTLCLNQGRFAVEIDWTTAAGANGSGQAVPLTADAGYFWFFDDANVELVIKVIDGCAYNGRYWVFAGGLTDVATHLVVRDTLHPGVVFERTKPVGVPFAPILSIEAFDTCP